MIATATEIQIKGVKGFVLFAFHLARVRIQLIGAPGLVALRFSASRQTLTVWDNRESLKAFRDRGAHLAAMRATRKIGRANVVSWETADIPSWQEAERRLSERR